MNFRDEYKKEISELTSDETAERIRRGVTDKLAEPEAAKKRPLPLRRIAVIGGSVAACLVIGVTALVLTGDGKYFFVGNMDNMNNMMSDNAPSAGANGATGGVPNMSSRPNYENTNAEDYTDDGQQNAEGLVSGGNDKDAIGDFSPGASMPAGSATDQDPSYPKTARITLDGELLTLEYNGETTVFGKSLDNNDGDKGSAPYGESGERIEAVTSDGKKMFLELYGDEALLFDSENRLLGIYITID